MIVRGVDELLAMEVGGGAAQTVGVVAFAKVGKQAGEVDAAGGAQLGDDTLVIAFVGGEVLYFVGHVLIVRCSNIVGEAAEVPAAVGAVVGMCSGTYAKVLDTLPVAAVVS